MTARRVHAAAVRALAAAAFLLGGPAAWGQELLDALLGGRPSLDMRYRYEYVDQRGLAREAHASTLRSRAGYETGTWRAANLFVEVDNISDIGGEPYDDGVEGRTRYPLVADDADTELSQGYVNYQGIPRTNLRAGRQFIDLDNERFIGGGRFRQNAQSFDAVTVTNDAVENLTLRYGWIANVNRAVGEDAVRGDFDSNSHFVNAAYSGFRWGRIVAYDYLLDLDDDAPELSSNTLGASLSADRRFRFNRDLAIGIDVEAARQTDHAGNPAGFALLYGRVEPRLTFGPLTLQIGYEVLGGNGTSAFQTPLGGLHGFNGATDRFVTTPADGLRDAYVAATLQGDDDTALAGWSFGVAFHDFAAEDTAARYGWEGSARVSRAFDLGDATGQPLRLLFDVEYARYGADAFSVDTDKFWASVTLRYN